MAKNLEANITGIRFGKLVGIEKSHLKRKWVFKCDCGTIVHSYKFQVISGGTISCGCIMKNNTFGRKHGMTRTREHNSWAMMKSRCLNPNVKSYKNYGAKGVKVSEKWLSFEGFLEDMGPRPKGFSLDRIDPTGDYCLENCRWADVGTQNRNKTNSQIIEIDGVSKRLPEWCIHFGVTHNTARYRIKNGWSHVKAVSFQGRTRLKNR